MHIFPRAGNSRGQPNPFRASQFGLWAKTGWANLAHFYSGYFFLLAHAGREPKRAKTLKNAKKFNFTNLSFFK